MSQPAAATVTSSDGTRIAYERVGSGPSVVLVDGALCHRKMGPSPGIAKALAGRFTVFTYDRRGRGGSEQGQSYTVDREIEDLAAVLREAGPDANAFGISSGAALVLEAAERGLSVRKLALYEAPFIVDASRPPLTEAYLASLQQAIREDRRGDALRIFMRTGVQAPAFFVFLMRLMPAWSQLKAVAPTLVHDALILGDTGSGKPLARGRWSHVTVPTWVSAGTKSPPWMVHGMRQLAEVLPNAKYVELPGQTHMVKPAVLGPALAQFFS